MKGFKQIVSSWLVMAFVIGGSAFALNTPEGHITKVIVSKAHPGVIVYFNKFIPRNNHAHV